jgi:hypothetical protein
MAPALRMTRSIKEKLPFFLLFRSDSFDPAVVPEFVFESGGSLLFALFLLRKGLATFSHIPKYQPFAADIASQPFIGSNIFCEPFRPYHHIVSVARSRAKKWQLLFD